ncbi:MAG TPA: hypothetical protein VFR38_12200 [Gaiellaceae bacterium]|nr:hypothetical protein [Gaiellaceae bacterium]
MTDFWSGANEPSAYYIVPLVSLVALDALVVMWAVRVGHRVSE